MVWFLARRGIACNIAAAAAEGNVTSVKKLQAVLSTVRVHPPESVES